MRKALPCSCGKCQALKYLALGSLALEYLALGGQSACMLACCGAFMGVAAGQKKTHVHVNNLPQAPAKGKCGLDVPGAA